MNLTDIEGVIQNIGDVAAGAQLVIETAFTPPITINLTPDPKSKSSVGPILKPRVQLLGKSGNVIFDEMPYGDPSDSHLGLITAAAGIAAFVGFIFLVRAL